MSALDDKKFLKALTEYRHRVIYIKIIKLQRNADTEEYEETSDMISGRATGGSINVDGSSALRRSCNISLVTEDTNINNYDWVLKTQFKLNIGLKNILAGNEEYENKGYAEEEIIWFPQGIYVLTSFNASLNTNSCTINLSGQDKMCLLNGEIGGILTAETDFGKYDQLDKDGNIVETKYLTLEAIIKNAVHTYAQEPFSNISVETPKKSGANLVEYRGDKPMYLLISKTLNENQDYEINNLTIYGDQPGKTANGLNTTIDSLTSYFIPAKLHKDAQTGNEFEGQYVQRIQYGEAAGYEQTELVYAGNLIAAVGESVVSILDKIKTMLGEYEYFYDIDGKFIFQKKKTSLKTLWNEEESEDKEESDDEEEYAYEFNDLSLFTSIANTPNLKNLKNDFTVWGKKKSISGAELPIHMRLAIDKKPTEYTNLDKQTFVAGEYDWRELIYQMARDYNFYKDNNIDIARTGYEPYYQDLLGYWRQLYNPEAKIKYTPTFYNDSGDLYTETWVSSFSGDKPFTDWYVLKKKEKDGKTIDCYIPWLDSLNLDQDQEINLRNLYTYDGEYKPLLTQNFLPAPYYVAVDSNNKKAIEQDENITSEEILKKLSYKAKDKSDHESIIQYIDLNAIEKFDSTIYLSKVVAEEGGIYKEVENTRIKGDEMNLSLEELWTSYKDPNKKIEFQYEEEGDWILKTPTIKFCAQKKDFKNDDNYAVYFVNSEGKRELYAKHLAVVGGSDGRKLDEFDLYTKAGDKYIHLVDLVRFDRMKVYVKKQVNIGGDNNIDQYLPLGEYASSQLSNKAGIYTLELNKENTAAAPRAQFDIYYKTNYKGELDTTITYYRPIKYYKKVEEYNSDHWHKNVHENPEGLLFWFDFLDPAEQEKPELKNLQKFSCKEIGNRNMAKNESMVTAIYYPSIPKVYYKKDFQLPESMKKLFAVSAQGQSAHNIINDWLYNHTYVTESITINSVPIYYLQPNTRIYISHMAKIDGEEEASGEETKIGGDYFVDKLTIPLSYNGTMTITATKAPTDLNISLDEIN